MFGHLSEPGRVYDYGAKLDRAAAPLVYEQIDRAWRYRNDLVALELDRRAGFERVVAEADPRLVELEAMIAKEEAGITAIRDAIRRANSVERRKAPDRESWSLIREARQRVKVLRAERKERRAAIAANTAVRAALDGLDAVTLEAAKRLRADSGLHWGTYLVIEQSLGGIRSGAPPRFVRRADWQGQVAVQIQGGASWDDLVAGHGQARIEPLPLPENATPGGRRSKRPWHRLHIRVGSEGRSRAPVWATATFALHRPVPADTRVKWIRLTRRRTGTVDHWSVQFVLARSAGWAKPDTTEARGAAALNLGWRSFPDGSLRVAYAVDDEGRAEELSLPAELLSRERKAADLQSIRDQRFELARATLVRWLAVADVPDWLREETATLAQWRSAARLAALALRWADARFSGDAEVFDALEAWRKKDRHLFDWQAHAKLSFQRGRREIYRRFAARLRWRYERVYLPDTDWRVMLRQPVAEEDTETLNRRAQARLASPGLLRQIVESGHPMAERVNPAGTTRACSFCGADAAHDWGAASEVVYRCTAGHAIDQDRNGLTNLLRAASGGVVSG